MTPAPIGSSTATQQAAAHRDVDAAGAASPTPEQKQAARDFEAIFLRQLMAPLEKSSGLSGGQSSGGEVFRSMMVGALADTASEGGGIGLSELILKAMLPPAPSGTPGLSTPAETRDPHAGASSPMQPGDAARTDTGQRALGEGQARFEPSGASRWGAASRVLTEARPAPMLQGAAGSLEPVRARRAPEEGSL